MPTTTKTTETKSTPWRTVRPHSNLTIKTKTTTTTTTTIKDLKSDRDEDI